MSKIINAYKIFEIDQETPKTLFHGLDGSRKLTVGKWLKANQMPVTDGSRQIPYTSGFHAYPDMKAVLQWLQTGKPDNRVVVEVELKCCTFKPNAIRPTYLAKWMRISRDNWEKRIMARDILKILIANSNSSHHSVVDTLPT
jgi:hypothetical protein